MKIRVVSDLHLELYMHDNMPYNYADMLLALQKNDPACDVLVLAGDIGKACTHVLSTFLDDMRKAYKRVIYVPGNHEYYNNCMRTADTWLRQNNANNLSYFEIDGVRFACCTLWCDSYSDQMTDFHVIRAGRDRVSKADLLTLHEYHMQWLINHPADVVVTHFAPVLDKCTSEEYREHQEGFASNALERLPWRPKHWIFGHTHYRTQFVEGGVTVSSNPIGYESEFESFADLVIEV